MPSLDYIFYGFLDTLTAHLVLVAFLLAVTDEKAVWQRLKKLPFLLPSPLLALLLTVGLQMAMGGLEISRRYLYGGNFSGGRLHPFFLDTG